MLGNDFINFGQLIYKTLESLGLKYREKLNLTAAEIDSIAADTLTRAEQNYNHKTAFMAYYRQALKNNLLKASQRKQRLEKMSAAEFESALHDIEQVLQLDAITNKFKFIQATAAAGNIIFTDNEVRYINLFGHVAKAPTDNQAAALLQVSRQSIHNIKRSLKSKLEPARQAYRDAAAGELISQFTNKFTGEMIQDPTAAEAIRRAEQ